MISFVLFINFRKPVAMLVDIYLHHLLALTEIWV